VNPGHGITVQHDRDRRRVREGEGRAAEAERLPPLHAQPLGERASRVDAGRLVGRVPGSVDDAELQSLSLAGGLDMSQKYDLTALVLTFKTPLDGRRVDRRDRHRTSSASR
jgi:hypothetical protein